MPPHDHVGPVSPGRKRRWLWLALLVLLLIGLYIAINFARISRQSRLDEARPADAIVVFGAAQYAGRPSPIFRARLDHALTLAQKQVAPLVIVTGGQGDDLGFSEGGVGRDYLISRGMAEPQVIAETESNNTIESARRVSTIMKANGLSSCIAVSDDYHIFRIKKMMAREGITCYGAPRPQANPPVGWQRSKLIFREILSYTLWLMRLT
jgi:uncharacterized SAM-binding protein YcdF (DUF218 family)